MRVVVTRPEHSAARTADRLKALGHEPMLLPLTEAAHDHAAVADGLAKPHSALILTSAEAVRAIIGGAESLADIASEKVYAVGEATAQAARQAGFADIRTGPGTGAGLAEMIAAEKSHLAKPLLYLAGDPRSPELEDALERAGIAIMTALIYRMVPIDYGIDTVGKILLSPQADAVMLYSRRNAVIFLELAEKLGAEMASLKILCLSANVAAAIPPQFQNNVRVAKSPDEDGLFALL
ncbi:uroporphyrinogen-III synthase [Neorhizobium alkalisoli]|uniref:Uroporphyrinogen-III synthase n=1 Tax=Neorhizobium alkalisoli TaxID=528178 RepID=A0A561QIS1_9HYPH|nr:uroporphyrinogen-III synthase [Neorhizobium alkalisoli]TWF50249.1 uroporphyrinogen-III synthase [Neorhizobium alkalisoli]